MTSAVAPLQYRRMVSKRLVHSIAALTGGATATISKWISDPESVTAVHRYAFARAVAELDLESELREARAAGPEGEEPSAGA